MLHRLWLLFAQICTVALALLFVAATLRPEWVRMPWVNAQKSASTPAPASPVVLPAAQISPIAAPVTPVASFAPAVKRALPAVVSIQTRRVDRRASPFAGDPVFERLFGRRSQEQQSQPVGEGSGVIVSADGMVLTNFHVISGATDIDVMLVDGRMLKAKVIGADPESDLAVLKVEEANLPTMTLGNSDALQVGDVVLAMGNPFGISNTVTMGIISALARKRVSETNPFEDFIQTDAAINPGNSGGPLVNTTGELVGINSAIFTRTGSTAGIGFSIPSNLVRSTMEQIVATGSVSRGYLGVAMQDVQGVKGAGIYSVVEDGPAANAGLRRYDVILEINGKPVGDQFEAIATIAGTKPGTKVPLTVQRRSERLTIDVTLDKRPPLRAQKN